MSSSTLEQWQQQLSEKRAAGDLVTTDDGNKLLPALDGVEQHDTWWSAQCPAHGDDMPSLSIAVTTAGKTLVCCHAGCSVDDIVDAVGLTVSDLFPQPDAYQYEDELGNRLYAVCVARKEDGTKNVWQMSWDAAGQVVNGVKGVRRVPYCLPELLAEPDRTVHIVEGEKDVERLRSLGLVATCNSGGAGKGEWSTWAEHFGGRNVVIWPDNDKPGADHAQMVAAALHGAAAAVRVVELPGVPEHGDVSDWLDAGGTLDGLSELVQAAPAWEVGAVQGDRTRGLSSLPWSQYRSLPRPPWLVRGLLRQRSTVTWFGDTGSYKTFLALDLCASVTLGKDWLGHEMVTSGPVLYVAAEGAETIAERVEIWEKQHDQAVPDSFHIMSTPAHLTDPEAMEDLRLIIEQQRPIVIVFDTLSKSMSGADESDNTAINAVLDAVDRIKEQHSGITVVLIHHPGHTNKDRERGASALPDGVDCRLMVERTADMYGRITCKKQKRGKKFDPIGFRLSEHEFPGEDGDVETTLVVVGPTADTDYGELAAGATEVDQIRDERRKAVETHLKANGEARERDLADLPGVTINSGSTRRRFFDEMQEAGLIQLVREDARKVKIWALPTP